MLSIITAYILNNTFVLPAIFTVTFRRLIRKVWVSVADFVYVCWHAFISVLYLCIASFVIMSLAAGSRGGYFVSEYVAEHVTPIVLIAIFAFAQLFLQVSNLYSAESVCVRRVKTVHASDIVVRIKSFFTSFTSPAPVLLQ